MTKSKMIILGIFVLSLMGHNFVRPEIIFASSANYIQGVNIIGGDIGVVWEVTDPSLCDVACKKNRNCKAWTWVKPGSLPGILRRGTAGFCALKGSIPNKTKNNCCISGYADTKGLADNLPDRDNDKIPDVDDNCPNVANADQKDSNNNRIGDACENSNDLKITGYVKANQPGKSVIKKVMSNRFQIIMNGKAVIDNRTKLIWERSPRDGDLGLIEANYWCWGVTTGQYKGWKVPSILDFISLYDKKEGWYPFINMDRSRKYWTSTKAPHTDDRAMTARIRIVTGKGLYVDADHHQSPNAEHGVICVSDTLKK